MAKKVKKAVETAIENVVVEKVVETTVEQIVEAEQAAEEIVEAEEEINMDALNDAIANMSFADEDEDYPKGGVNPTLPWNQKYREATEEEANDPNVVWKEVRLGRPVNPDSKAQQRARELEERRAAGLVRRGRPANPESATYQRKMELEARRAAGEEVKRGRPADPNKVNSNETKHGFLGRPMNPDSERQKRLAELEAKRQNGEVRLGRPKKNPEEATETKHTFIIRNGKKLVPLAAFQPKPVTEEVKTPAYDKDLVAALKSMGVE